MLKSIVEKESLYKYEHDFPEGKEVMNEGLLDLHRIRFQASYKRLKTFIVKTMFRTIDEYNDLIESRKMQVFKWNSLVIETVSFLTCFSN